MFEDIQKHRQAVRENIEKSLQIGYTESEDFEKAHKVGDIHPNGKWVWTQLPSGKFDWRVIKLDKPGGNHVLNQISDKQRQTYEEIEDLINHGKRLTTAQANFYNNLKPSMDKLKKQASSTAAKSASSDSPTTPKKVPGGKRINYDDDIVEVYDNKGKKVYAGILDDTPYKDEDYRWNDKDKNYDLPHGYKMVGK